LAQKEQNFNFFKYFSYLAVLVSISHEFVKENKKFQKKQKKDRKSTKVTKNWKYMTKRRKWKENTTKHNKTAKKRDFHGIPCGIPWKS
jgi:hypothetical protein